jgi:hypothetical protein
MVGFVVYESWLMVHSRMKNEFEKIGYEWVKQTQLISVLL